MNGAHYQVEAEYVIFIYNEINGNVVSVYWHGRLVIIVANEISIVVGKSRYVSHVFYLHEVWGLPRRPA
jgi:hypothetical protein